MQNDVKYILRTVHIAKDIDHNNFRFIDVVDELRSCSRMREKYSKRYIRCKITICCSKHSNL